jgi:putative FmdB family regulatory protein
MPIYPYVCTACGHEFDTLQKISEAPLTDCPACGESGLRKRLAAPAFKLKGTGWYETDFKNDGKEKKAKDDDSKESKDGKPDHGKESSGKQAGDTSSGESKSDSKPQSAGANTKPTNTRASESK